MVTPGDIGKELGGEFGSDFVGDLLASEHLGDPVVVEHLGHVDANEERVGDCPRLRTITKDAEFEWERLALLLLRNEGIHAARVDFQIVLVAVAEVLDRVLGEVTESKDALLPVVREGGRAEDFAKFTGRVTAAEVHLPEAILGGDIALREEEVVEIVSTDVRDSLLVADDLDGRAKSGDRNGAVQLRESCTSSAEEPEAYASGRQDHY